MGRQLACVFGMVVVNTGRGLGTWAEECLVGWVEAGTKELTGRRGLVSSCGGRTWWAWRVQCSGNDGLSQGQWLAR